jgi:hypothetical protein
MARSVTDLLRIARAVAVRLRWRPGAVVLGRRLQGDGRGALPSSETPGYDQVVEAVRRSLLESYPLDRPAVQFRGARAGEEPGQIQDCDPALKRYPRLHRPLHPRSERETRTARTRALTGRNEFWHGTGSLTAVKSRCMWRSRQELTRTQRFKGNPKSSPAWDLLAGSTQRVVTTLPRVKKCTPSVPCACVSPKSDRFQPPKE